MKLTDFPVLLRGARRARDSARDQLRSATRAEHEKLDSALGDLDLANKDHYVRFLRFHAVARSGVESWLAQACPAGYEPPPQMPLVEADLGVLEEPAPRCVPSFDHADPRGWMGVAYVVAGSHLGNRVLLSRLGPDLASRASAFLAGEAMSAYWRTLRGLLDQPLNAKDGARVTGAARAAFAHFAKVATTTGAVTAA